MRVFISWSGDQSRNVAAILAVWLPMVIQAIKPWTSIADIEKGEGWFSSIQQSLADSKGVGIFCLTATNLTAPWLAFEAGAIASQDKGRVATFLFGVESEAMKAPLALFQATKATMKEDVFRLLESLNKRLNDPLSEGLLEKSFEANWQSLATQLAAIPAPAIEPPKPSADQTLNEILGTVRRLEKAAVRPVETTVSNFASGGIMTNLPRLELSTEDLAKLYALLGKNSNDDLEHIVGSITKLAVKQMMAQPIMREFFLDEKSALPIDGKSGNLVI